MPKNADRARAAACRDALRGNADAAEEPLRGLAGQGDAAAAASLVQLLAFRDDWAGLSSYAFQYLAHADAVYSMNVLIDTLELLAAGGRRGGGWPELATQARHAAAELHARPETRRHALLIDDFVAYCGGPHEGLVFADEPESGMSSLDAYREAVDRAVELRPDLMGDPEALAAHRFSLAVVYRQAGDALEQYGNGAVEPDFGQALFLTRTLLRNGTAERAWELVREALPRWWPVDPAQLAPVELVYDDDLARMLTPARRAEILSTPRGPAAEGRSR